LVRTNTKYSTNTDRRGVKRRYRGLFSCTVAVALGTLKDQDNSLSIADLEATIRVQVVPNVTVKC
jgi:hypothetical protein